MQTTIPMPEQRETDRGVCAWCGESADYEIELEPAQYTHRRNPKGKKKTIKLLKRAALVVKVCKHHYLTLERNPDRREGSA